MNIYYIAVSITVYQTCPMSSSPTIYFNGNGNSILYIYIYTHTHIYVYISLVKMKKGNLSLGSKIGRIKNTTNLQKKLST